MVSENKKHKEKTPREGRIYLQEALFCVLRGVVFLLEITVWKEGFVNPTPFQVLSHPKE